MSLKDTCDELEGLLHAYAALGCWADADFDMSEANLKDLAKRYIRTLVKLGDLQCRAVAAEAHRGYLSEDEAETAITRLKELKKRAEGL